MADLHYLTFDPEAMWTEMHIAYMQAGGDPLYPGDEKEIFLRAQMAVLLQTYAAFDHAARMQTLRYAVGEYLDVKGENRNIERIQAVKATGKVTMTITRGTSIYTVPAGTLMTDGARSFETTEAVSIPAGTGTMSREAFMQCTVAGADGNGMPAGAQLNLKEQNARITGIVVSSATMGGVDQEENEAYRDRIREGGFYGATTGPKGAYEAHAMEVSASIVDAGAYMASAGVVGVALILEDGLTEAEQSTIKQAVEQALSAETVRPLNDTVNVDKADEVAYSLTINYQVSNASVEDVPTKLLAAVEEYQKWQENKVGRAFDPFKLLALLYGAGAVRAEWSAGSTVSGGAVAYTAIAPNQRLKGTVTLQEMEA